MASEVVSGDGFITLADGTRRWGRFGAAGILVRHHDDGGEPHLFLARRSLLCHRGGTWAIPGGALDQGEAPLAGALREFAEETGVVLEGFEIAEVHEDDHGGWSYWTLVVDLVERFPLPTALSWETSEVRWVPCRDLEGMELFDAFGATLERLGLHPRTPGLGPAPH
jgi:ADP-ribose pyrophosphatase YjhB (NUDIX family)